MFETKQPTKIKPQIYGADWCSDNIFVMNYLRTIGVAFDYYNQDKDEAAKAVVKKFNPAGEATIPVVIIGEDVLIAPDMKELNMSLNRYGLLQVAPSPGSSEQI
jgi:glutaredoxin